MRLLSAAWVIGILFLVTSCSSMACRIPGCGETPEDDRTARLVIVSQGMALPKDEPPRILIKYIQYSLDGRLLRAHEVIKDFQHTIPVKPGRHVLHVERLQRGILSARAFILDSGDCYTFTVDGDQTATFEGRALPKQKWEAYGFTDIETWEQFESRNRCRE